MIRTTTSDEFVMLDDGESEHSLASVVTTIESSGARGFPPFPSILLYRLARIPTHFTLSNAKHVILSSPCVFHPFFFSFLPTPLR